MNGAPAGELVARFAGRFHRAVGATHHVASPLGAWLLLALIAPVADDSARAPLEDALGCPASEADRIARDLLRTEHPSLTLAAVAWSRVHSDELDRWLAGLRPVAEVGDVPSQAGADAWASEHTAGLIPTFPVAMSSDLLLVLASAVACDVEWTTAFEVVATGDLRLPRDPAFAALRSMLRSPDECDQLIASTPVGPVAVHAAESADGSLLVASVIAATDIAATDVLTHAHPIATALALGDEPNRVSLFDLPLGDGPAWTLSEQPAARDEEQVQSILPAWSATSHHDLTDAAGLGVPAGLHVLGTLAGGAQGGAVQSAVARYTATGFRAAAVTAMFFRASAAVGHRGRKRVAHVEFGRPYAVVAVGRARGDGNADNPWTGLPAFSAWVATPEEAGEPASR